MKTWIIHGEGNWATMLAVVAAETSDEAFDIALKELRLRDSAIKSYGIMFDINELLVPDTPQMIDGVSWLE